MSKSPISSRVFVLLQIGAVCVFWGRAWQHWFWDAPYRALLWDENWMSGIIEGLFGMQWEAYVTSSGIDAGIQTWIKLTACFYFLAGVSCIFIRQWGRFARLFIWIGGLNLILLALLYFKEQFFAIGQLLEYALQVISPFLLLFVHRFPFFKRERFILSVKIAIVLTFTCHGLYALGYYPRPGHFQEMVMNTIGLSGEGVVVFLNLAGVLDFVMSILLFLPWRKVQIAGLAYAVFWGFFTSIARVWAFVHWEYLWSGLHQWWYETVLRFPHFIIPLALLLIIRQLEDKGEISKTGPKAII